MSVLLVRPPSSRKGWPVRPLGLGCIMSAQPAGVTASLLDLDLEVQTGRMTIEAAFAHTVDLAMGCTAVGISTMCNTHPYAIRLAREIKERDSHVRIVLGGSHTSATGSLNLRFPWIDAIVIGEGETAFWDAVSGHGPAVQGQSPDRWPVPRFPDDHEQVYATGGLDVEAARGCPFHCRYCSSSSIWGGRFRPRDPLAICQEIAGLKDRCRVHRFGLSADLLSADPDWERELLSSLAALQVEWTCSTRPGLVTDETLSLMKDSGCIGIYYGIESGDERLRRSVGKMIEDDRLTDCLRATHRHGIPYTASFIIGLPGETEQTLESTLRSGLYCRRNGATKVQFHVAMPIYGTALYGEGHRLELDRELVNVGYDLLSGADLELIEQHPDLMASFYSIPVAELRAADLYFCHTVFASVVNFFPRSLELVADAAGGMVAAMRDLFFRFDSPKQWPRLPAEIAGPVADWCGSYPDLAPVVDVERGILAHQLRRGPATHKGGR